MDTLTERSSFARALRDQDDGGSYPGGSLVLWTAAIVVLIGLNFGSWSFCMWVFGHPEHPMNYQILTKLNKLDPLTTYSPVSAPRGRFQAAKDLYAKVYPFDERTLRAYNGMLKRAYLTNFGKRAEVTYISGDFRVLSVEPLKAGDVFPKGWVVRAASSTFPEAILDLALPSDDVNGEFEIPQGTVIHLEEASLCVVVLNVHRQKDDVMVFTAVPLVTVRGGANPEPRVLELDERAQVRLKVPSTIALDPDMWPISQDVELIEKRPEELAEPANPEDYAVPEP